MWQNHAGSHPGSVGPGREIIQLKHGPAPAVNGQCDAHDANDVHHYSCPGLVMERREEKSLKQHTFYSFC